MTVNLIDDQSLSSANIPRSVLTSPHQPCAKVGKSDLGKSSKRHLKPENLPTPTPNKHKFDSASNSKQRSQTSIRYVLWSYPEPRMRVPTTATNYLLQRRQFPRHYHDKHC